MIKLAHKEEIQKRLLRWYGRNRRDLPWRRSRDPYAIWVSEIMLQQTQVPTVIPYYHRFLKLFPTVGHLAKVDLSKVLKVWEGLGYYSRARNLHRASQIIVQQHDGIFPKTPDEIQGLPGIGRYTAGAILSIAFNQDVPVLDGNVKRIFPRLFAISGNPRTPRTEKMLWEISETMVPRGHAGAFNQALMDLGSMICTVKAPSCPSCPVRDFCKAHAEGNPERYPLKAARKSIPHLEAVSAVIVKEDKVLLRQRPPEGLLGGLWEFPHWEVKRSPEKGRKKALRSRLRRELDRAVEIEKSLGTFEQTYSHFKLTLEVYLCRGPEGKAHGHWVSLRNLRNLPMSRIHRRVADAVSSLPDTPVKEIRP